MYIQYKLVATSIFTLCMLTVSFLLSSLTVLQNNNGSQMGTSSLAQSNISALLIESMPESCEDESTQESETCLRVNVNPTSDLATSRLVEDGQTTKGSIVLASNVDTANISSLRREKKRSNSTGEIELTTANTFDNLRSNPTTVAIIIPEPTATTEARELIVTTVLDTNINDTSDRSTEPLSGTGLLACEMATRQWLGQTASNGETVLASTTHVDENTQDDTASYKWLSLDDEIVAEDGSLGLNSVCVELYRDNGDAIANANEDQFIGFSLIMDDSTSNPEHYQFPNLPPGTYFAKFYPMADSFAVSSTVEQRVESDTNTLKGAIAIDQASREKN